MKKLVFLFFTILMIVQSLDAQPVEKKILLKNEFYVSYGAGSVQEIGSLFADAFFSIFFFNDNLEIKNTVGPIIIGYKRNLGMNFTVGLSGSYTEYKSELRKKDNNNLESTNAFDFYTMMLRADFVYGTNKWVQMYSGLSVGGVYFKLNTTYTDGSKPLQSQAIHLAEHVNAFGIRVGHSIGGFLELGYGFNGIINLGVTYKF